MDPFMNQQKQFFNKTIKILVNKAIHIVFDILRVDKMDPYMNGRR